jgi:hypothetical protein
MLTLQTALGFIGVSRAGVAMELVAFNLWKPRSAVGVFSRLLRLLGPGCTMHLDCCLDYYDTLIALAAGWICTRSPLNAHALFNLWLAGVFPTDRVSVVQLVRTFQGHLKKIWDAENSHRWQFCILGVLLAQLVPCQGRSIPLRLLRMAPIPKDFQMGALTGRERNTGWCAGITTLLAQNEPMKAHWRCMHLSGGHVLNQLQQIAQVCRSSQTACVAKHLAVAKTFALLSSGEPPPVDLLGEEQVRKHDLVSVLEHRDHVALLRIAAYCSRGMYIHICAHMHALSSHAYPPRENGSVSFPADQLGLEPFSTDDFCPTDASFCPTGSMRCTLIACM